ncbi:MAG: AAA family ATPase [Planctomycetes bacterium]|nr:AAA family ATPase [Planctomycetota bacterium]
MNAIVFNPLPMDQLAASEATLAAEWLWDGYLARGNITVLTSMWKSGKTTLIAGLLRALANGGTFLGRACSATRALIVSEESPTHWLERTQCIPIGRHSRLISRPFTGRPTPEQWDELIRRAEQLREFDNLDLFVVDPLASFLPGRSESDPCTLLEMLEPLRRLAERGVAVLVLHHPRKKASEEGHTARGSGALLGFVDVILELHRCGNLPSDSNRRRLVGLSRRLQTPASLVYEWVLNTPEFKLVTDPLAVRFRENWESVRAMLESRKQAVTHKELLADWPVDRVPPSATVLYEWLARAAGEGLVERLGSGTRDEPFRFRLPSKGDRLGELRPLW